MSTPSSLRELLLSASDADLPHLLASLSPDEAQSVYYEWAVWARPEQLTPPGDWWRIWLILAGRGWGKTKTGAEDVKAYGLTHAQSRIGIVAPTYADARDTCVEGESGLLSCLPERAIAKWNRSLGELALTNGSQYKLFSADEPERLRGPQHHRMWFDELGAWKYAQETFDMAMFGLRLGTNPQAVITTTPRPIPLVRDLVKRAGQDVAFTKGRTLDNRDNMAPAFFSQIIARYSGTRLGRQELDAEILDDNPGALWRRDAIDALRVSKPPQRVVMPPDGGDPDQDVTEDALSRVVVAVDPAATHGEDSDDTGIVVAAIGGPERHGYVLADVSVKASPHGWAAAAVHAYYKHRADRIVAEANQGGEMVEHTIRTVDPNVPITLVHASRGKYVRAEPVAALYEQAKVHHVGCFPQLEDQMCGWTPGDADSPDRMDALVWALTDLMIDGAGRDWGLMDW